MLTADTYVSVLPALAKDATETTARLVAEVGQRAPGAKHVTQRKPNPPDRQDAAALAPRSSTTRADRSIHTDEKRGPVQDWLRRGGKGGQRPETACGDNWKGRVVGAR